MAIKAGQLKERADYQAYILEMLREENGYQVRPATSYDPGYGMDVELLFPFLEATQKDSLTRLEKLYGDKTRQTILNYINNEVNKKNRSLLDVLKHGVEFDNGVSLILMSVSYTHLDVYKRQILDCIIENGGNLVVDCLEIGLRIRLPFFISVAGQFILPALDVCGLDGVQRYFAKEWGDLQIDQKAFIGDGGGPQPPLHILQIQFDKILEDHPQACGSLNDEIPFPL